MRKLNLTFLVMAMMMIYMIVPVKADSLVANHNVIAEFAFIPDSVVNRMRTDLKIFYGHSSHGSQIVTGMTMLGEEDSVYDIISGQDTLDLIEYGGDLGYEGDTSWVPITRQYLDQPGSDINLVMWSWCWGCSENTPAGIDIYLNAMNELEQEYPHVIFVYMTGHLDGTGISGNLYTRNNQIRAYCSSNQKVLFDFADIESYDPDGTYFPDDSDYCSWCESWCLSHSCAVCDECAHSNCFNCYQKGKAFWWMLARLSGWSYFSGVDSGDKNQISEGFELKPNFPNPFNPSTTIRYSLPDSREIDVSIYNLLGQKIKTLAQKIQPVGTYTISWDGTSDLGTSVAAGLYICRVQASKQIMTQKMILLK